MRYFAIGIAAILLLCPAAAQQEQSADSANRVVVSGMAPVPDVGEGAPLFTSDDVAELRETLRETEQGSKQDKVRCFTAREPSPRCEPRDGIKGLLGCEMEYAGKAANLAEKARQATLAAEDARRDVAAGRVDAKVSEAAELARQDAVNRMEAARQKLLETQAMMADLQELAMRRGLNVKETDAGLTLELQANALKRSKAGWGLDVAEPEVPEGLSIVSIRAIKAQDKKGDFVRIQGEIRNASTAARKLPGLSATLVDDKGWPLSTATVEARGSIPASGSQAFAFDVRPAPSRIANAVVTFATKNAPPPRVNMNSILCPRDGFR